MNLIDHEWNLLYGSATWRFTLDFDTVPTEYLLCLAGLTVESVKKGSEHCEKKVDIKINAE